jgi:hypothetical protein
VAANDGTPRYQLGPRSTRGLIAGWRSGQIVCVAAGLIVAVGALRSIGGGGGALVALMATCAGIGAATWPLAGRSPEQWAPTVASFAARAVAEGRYRPWQTTGSRRGPIATLSLFQLPDPVVNANKPSEARTRRAEAARDGQASILRVADDVNQPFYIVGDARNQPSPAGIAVIADGKSGTWSAVIPVGGTGFALLDEAQRADRIAEWSGALASMATEGRGLHRLQWLACTYPSSLDGSFSGGGFGRAGADYGRLLQEAGPHLWTHEVLLTVTIRQTGLRRGAKDEAAALLRAQLGSVAERLQAAGLSAGAPLSPLELVGRVRRSFDLKPFDGVVAWPWPVGIEDGWATLRTDTTCHATYWIAEWPRAAVAGGFLLPALLASGVRNVIGVTMAPLPPLTAVRRAERDRTEGTADAEMRERHGFAVTARARREQDSRQRREAELAEGHTAYRYSGYVTVTESDPVALEEACRRMEQSAVVAQLELRRLYGSQEEAFCATLPTGRGCR